MNERKIVSLGERWRREATRGIDDNRLAAALEALPSIRKSRVRIRAGSIHTEMEGSMGSIHEVSLQIRTLPNREWPTLIRVLRRSKSIVEALEQGRVPRSLDRLVARIVGEPLFPDTRSVTFGCSCDLPDKPCRHVLALHELFARRLDEKAYELLLLRGVDLHQLLADVHAAAHEGDLPPLPFGVPEEPVLYPDAEDADLGQSLSGSQVRWLIGEVSTRFVDATLNALDALSGLPKSQRAESAPDSKAAVTIAAPAANAAESPTASPAGEPAASTGENTVESTGENIGEGTNEPAPAAEIKDESANDSAPTQNDA